MLVAPDSAIGEVEEPGKDEQENYDAKEDGEEGVAYAKPRK